MFAWKIVHLSEDINFCKQKMMNYFALFAFGFIGFLIGRVLSLLVSLYFRQKGFLNAENARTLIVLGSGGKYLIN